MIRMLLPNGPRPDPGMMKPAQVALSPLPIKCAVISVFFLVMIFAPTSLVAQEPGPAASAQSELSSTLANAPIAPVVIDGTTYFMVRGSLSITAEERADDVQEQIIKAAEAKADAEPVMRLRSTELLTEIFADGVYITSVTAADAALEGFRTEIVADFISEEIAKAISDYRAIRSASSLERGVLNALVWSVVFIFLVGLFLIAWRYGRGFADAKVRQLLANVERRTGRVVDPADLTSGVRLLLNGVLIAAIAILVYY